MAASELLTTPRRYTELANMVPHVSAGAVNDLLLLEAGVRSVVRLSCNVAQLSEIENALLPLGFVSRKWRKNIEPASAVSASSNFVIAGRASDARADGDGRTFLFVARDDATAFLAENFAMDDAVLGALLGYPSCCVRAFVQHRDHYMQRLHPAFAIPGGNALPFWSNTMVDAFGWHLVSHFPCSAQCRQTREMALRNWSIIGKVDPERAIATLVHMRSVVLFDAQLGLAYGSKSGNGRRLNLLGASSQWSRVLNGETEIEVPETAAVFDFTGDADVTG